MFWVLKKSSLASQYLSNIFNNNSLHRDSTRQSKKGGYDRLTGADDEINGNPQSPVASSSSNSSQLQSPQTPQQSTTIAQHSPALSGHNQHHHHCCENCRDFHHHNTQNANNCINSSSLEDSQNSNTQTREPMSPSSINTSLNLSSTSDLYSPCNVPSEVSAADIDVDLPSVSSGSLDDSSDYERPPAEDSDSTFSSDDDEDIEYLTCNVCDRSYSSPRQLAAHQARKRHYGCSVCEDVFPSLLSLEMHREETNHWSDGELYLEEPSEEHSSYDDLQDLEERENLIS